MFRLLGILLILPAFCLAQPSHLYKFDIRTYGDGTRLLEKPVLLTDFNGGKSNVDPFIKKDGNILFTATFNNQSDVLELDLKAEKIINHTSSSHNEYFGQKIDGTLWYVQEGTLQSKKGNKINLPDKVEHYQIVDGQLYYSNEKKKLIKTDLSGSTRQALLDKLCSPMVFISSESLVTAGQTYSAERKYIRGLSASGAYKINEGMIGQNSFFTLDDADNLWMADGSKIYILAKPYNKDWVEVGNCQKLGLKNISQLAVRGNTLIAVAQ